VSTADLNQSVELKLLNKQSWGLYDLDIYPAGYIKDGTMRGKVTIFHTGKLISAGANNIHLSFFNLHRAKDLLMSASMVEDVNLHPQVRNIVATGDLNHKVDLLKLAVDVPYSIYEPEQFPGLMYRPKGHRFSSLIFASGKIVIAGAKTIAELSLAIKMIEAVAEGRVEK
jgi:transcription initiation factor TFIID TATA-box-binding protein